MDELYDIDKDICRIATRTVLVNDCYQFNQYCGKCGSKTHIKKGSMSLECPKCRMSFHGKIHSAVIIAINNDDKFLMARHGLIQMYVMH